MSMYIDTHNATHKKLTDTHSYVALYTYTLRVSGNGAGFPLFTEAPEGERADD